MKIYIAGKLGTDEERETLEKIDNMCRSLGFQTFLPHRDVGLLGKDADASKIFEGDINLGFKGVDLVVASLNGLHMGAGTSWELGYAYAKEIPCIGIKTDETPEEAIEYLSPILICSMPIVPSFDKLKDWLVKFSQEYA